MKSTKIRNPKGNPATLIPGSKPKPGVLLRAVSIRIREEETRQLLEEYLSQFGERGKAEAYGKIIAAGLKALLETQS